MQQLSSLTVIIAGIAYAHVLQLWT